ncbi:diheme cytochrome c-553 [uncultured Christiangramia sp.]|uniref:diheme cytochrome c-553 n=1 Tax=uncultured Christiangramia sp. TaxID=503836 RepID=UPI00262173A8|nr:diheme cytochrome c-553 [uncultured Christiangramia sp.]
MEIPKKSPSTLFKFIITGFLALTIVLISCQDKNDYAKVPAQELSPQDSISHGEYLVNTIGCHDCHSPKQMTERGPEIIPELALSGYQSGDSLPSFSSEAIKNGWIQMSGDLTVAIGPWGISYASNLTSSDTGLGNWSMQRFKTAIREGKLKGDSGGEMILPPMPWQNYSELTDKDLESIFRYLKSTKPVENAVHAPVAPNKLDSLQNA